MDPNSGRIHAVTDEADAKRRGLIPFRRELTDEEKRTGQVSFNAPCACGSGRKFKRCCYLKRRA